MDSIHTVIDSLSAIKVILPDSLHTWQQAVKPEPDNSKWYSILTSLIIAIGGYIWVAKKENDKEVQRLEDIKNHVLTWIHINKLQCARMGNDCENMGKQIHRYSPILPIRPIVDYKFYFEQILAINKIDLTKFFLPKTKEKDNNYEKLYIVTNMNNDIIHNVQDEKLAYKENIIEFDGLTLRFIDNCILLKAEIDKILGSEKLEELLYNAISGHVFYGNSELMKEYYLKFDDEVKLMPHDARVKVYTNEYHKIFKEQIVELCAAANLIMGKYDLLAHRFFTNAKLLSLIERYYIDPNYSNKDFNSDMAIAVNRKHLKMMLAV